MREIAVCAGQSQRRGAIEVGDYEVLDLRIAGSGREGSVKCLRAWRIALAHRVSISGRRRQAAGYCVVEWPCHAVVCVRSWVVC